LPKHHSRSRSHCNLCWTWFRSFKVGLFEPTEKLCSPGLVSVFLVVSLGCYTILVVVASLSSWRRRPEAMSGQGRPYVFRVPWAKSTKGSLIDNYASMFQKKKKAYSCISRCKIIENNFKNPKLII
jgi:hypothetical protein